MQTKPMQRKNYKPMRKAKLWFLAAVLTCGTMTVTTSCEQLLKATVDVVEAVKMTGVWEVTESPANSLGFHKGTTWTFDSNLTYTVSSGASGKWSLKQSVVTMEPKGQSEFTLGTLDSANKKNMTINLNGTNGQVKFKKISDLESSKK